MIMGVVVVVQGPTHPGRDLADCTRWDPQPSAFRTGRVVRPRAQFCVARASLPRRGVRAPASTCRVVPDRSPARRDRDRPGRSRPARRRLRHDEMEGGAAGAESSRSRSGRAASRSHSRISRSSRAVARAPAAARSRSASSTAHARTYRSSCNASSSDRAMTSSPSLSCSSPARCLATQSHWRQRCPQNSRGRPGPDLAGNTRRHQRHRVSSVMTKSCRPGHVRGWILRPCFVRQVPCSGGRPVPR